jgi:anhydro-N-acetylmuramic acid kinase
MQEYKAIGLMSGSSLDGVDLCYAEFYYLNGKWTYRNCIVETVNYTGFWKTKLSGLGYARADEFYQTHVNYGHYLGEMVNSFKQKHKLELDLISSHGHTIFHQPQNRFTAQIGDGAAIFAKTGIKTVTDFRSVDIALGGQGAPLVPVGERDLFDDYGMFLNLGGIANISIFNGENIIKAFDISACNMPLNILCEKYFDTSFDKEGSLSRKGKLNLKLLDELNAIPYFEGQSAKSLGREFILAVYLPIIESYSIPPEDKLSTVCHHISDQIAIIINKNESALRSQNMMVTGGGAYNSFLMELIKQKSKIEIIVPPSLIVEFKEALIFSYLGILRILNQNNALASVTNANADSSGGAIWG